MSFEFIDKLHGNVSGTFQHKMNMIGHQDKCQDGNAGFYLDHSDSVHSYSEVIGVSEPKIVLKMIGCNKKNGHNIIVLSVTIVPKSGTLDAIWANFAPNVPEIGTLGAF